MELLVCATEYYPHGFGIANVAHHVVERLRAQGVGVTVCSPTGPEIVLGSSDEIRRFAIGGLLRYWSAVGRSLDMAQYDAVWLHNPLFVRGRPPERSLGTIHSMYRDKLRRGVAPGWYYRMTAGLERRSFERFDPRTRFSGVSSLVCDDLASLGIDPSKIVEIPNGVDTAAFSPGNDREALRRRFGLDDADGPVVLSLGRVADTKRPEALIEVFARVQRSLPTAVLIVAGGGERLQSTQARASSLGLGDAVRFLGPVPHDEVPALYRLADCYIMASRSEGSPLSLLEALSSGLPAIVSSIPQLEFVGREGLGVVVDFDDTTRAAERISEYLLGDLVQDARRARQFALERLDWSVIADRYLAEFEAIAGGDA
jgi:glycosyltransferase involved in cell wall biosynthesis